MTNGGDNLLPCDIPARLLCDVANGDADQGQLGKHFRGQFKSVSRLLNRAAFYSTEPTPRKETKTQTPKRKRLREAGPTAMLSKASGLSATSRAIYLAPTAIRYGALHSNGSPEPGSARTEAHAVENMPPCSRSRPRTLPKALQNHLTACMSGDTSAEPLLHSVQSTSTPFHGVPDGATLVQGSCQAAGDA